jgi:ATP-dependent RNA helicase DeaD
MVDELSAFLNAEGFAAESIHGDINQGQRTRVMTDFKSSKTTLLVATDVAARGIDVNDIEYIINYDIPQSAEYYIHRIGRTARAGKSGTAVTIISGGKQVEALKDIARQTNVQIDVLTIPTGRDVKNKAMDGFIREIEETIKNEDTAQFKGMYDALAASGYTPDEIALAALTLQFGKNAAKLKQIKEVAAEKEPDKKPKGKPPHTCRPQRKKKAALSEEILRQE